METEKTSSLPSTILNTTYYDVEIKLVEIVNPSSTSVKFQEGAVNADSNNIPLSSQVNLAEEEYENNIGQEENIDIKLQKSTVQFTDTFQAGGESPMKLRAYPLQVVKAEQEQDHHEDKLNETSKVAKQKHKENMLFKRQQLMESLSRNNRRQSAKKQERTTRFYEVAPGLIVAERPLSQMPSNFQVDHQEKSMPSANNQPHANRAATVPGMNRGRVWTGHRSVASSRAVSSVSSRWKMEELSLPKRNALIKMPFKQAPQPNMDDRHVTQDEVLLPGDELRATTAFAVSRIRHAFRKMPPPSRNSGPRGRLLKARLRPLQSAKVDGPRISSCNGVQPEVRKRVSDSPSPSHLKELKEKYLEACKVYNHTVIREEYKRRKNANSVASEQSLHRTSPQPADVDTDLVEMYPVNVERGFPVVEEEEQFESNYDKYSRHDHADVSHRMAQLQLQSSVIY